MAAAAVVAVAGSLENSSLIGGSHDRQPGQLRVGGRRAHKQLGQLCSATSPDSSRCLLSRSDGAPLHLVQCITVGLKT